jgi:hypothetical protein
MLEKAIIGTVLGGVPVIACFLAGWWISLPFVPESRIVYCALGGLVLGMVIDVIFLRSWIRRAYSMKAWVWMAVYVFYSIGLLGFFMGVPVFNVMLALPAGIFVGRRLAYIGADIRLLQKARRQAAVFTVSIMGLVCVTSASIALASRSTGSDLQGLLGLSFQITPTMIIGIIVGGGALLLALDWWLTNQCVERAYGHFIGRADGPCALQNRAVSRSQAIR